MSDQPCSCTHHVVPGSGVSSSTSLLSGGQAGNTVEFPEPPGPLNSFLHLTERGEQAGQGQCRPSDQVTGGVARATRCPRGSVPPTGASGCCPRPFSVPWLPATPWAQSCFTGARTGLQCPTLVHTRKSSAGRSQSGATPNVTGTLWRQPPPLSWVHHSRSVEWSQCQADGNACSHPEEGQSRAPRGLLLTTLSPPPAQDL